jgi:hypothetical protein
MMTRNGLRAKPALRVDVSTIASDARQIIGEVLIGTAKDRHT